MPLKKYTNRIMNNGFIVKKKLFLNKDKFKNYIN